MLRNLYKHILPNGGAKWWQKSHGTIRKTSPQKKQIQVIVARQEQQIDNLAPKKIETWRHKNNILCASTLEFFDALSQPIIVINGVMGPLQMAL